MKERDVSRRYEGRPQRESWRGDERGMGGRSEYASHGTRRWGAGEDWDEDSDSRTQGHYAGDYEAGRGNLGSRMGRSYAQENLGRDEQEWSQGRREAQRWGEQGTYGVQGSSEYPRSSGYGREREYGQGRQYAQGRESSQSQGRDYRGYGAGPREYASPGQGEGEHGYGSGRDYRGYEGGEAGRRAGMRHWERGFGEGYGLSSGYADEQAYGSRYGSDDDTGAGRSLHEGARSYRGMGPKSYTRSDERVLEDVNERLTEDHLLDASDITVRCVAGVITLEGTVAERWMKHRAEDLVDASSGVKQVDNRIQVKSQYGRASERSASSTESTQSRTRQGTATPSSSSSSSSSRSGGDPGASSQH